MAEHSVPTNLKRLVQARAKFNCEYCFALSQFSFHPFPIDHIVPTSKGGDTQPENLALACAFCNGSKINKVSASDPLTGISVPLFHPRKDNWPDHFKWNENFTIILGISQKGRATVECLKMNREEAVNIRAALYHFGVHPPA